MTIEELQTKYLEVVGRSTGSDDRRYLIWKIREAEKGRINVGPRKTRARDGEPFEVKILYRRMRIALEDGAAVETYLLAPEQVEGRPVIDSGNWRARRKEWRA